MSIKTRKHSTFRLTNQTRSLLKRLAKADGITMTAVVQQLIRRESWQRLDRKMPKC